MSLLTLHRIVIGMAMGACAAYAVFEIAHAREHGPGRAAAGIVLPLAGLVGLGVYLSRLRRITRAP